MVLPSVENTPNTASRKSTGIVMHPIPDKHRSHGGGSRDVFRQFARLEVGSVKVASPRPGRAPGWCPAEACGAYPLGTSALWVLTQTQSLGGASQQSFCIIWQFKQ